MATEINVEEMKELAAALADHTPADTEEMAAICAELHAAMNAQDEITAARKRACAELEKQLAELRAPFETQLAAVGAVIVAGKAALVRRIDADEAAALALVLADQPVPEPRQLPKGLRVKTTLAIAEVDVAKLGEDFLTLVPDVDAILRAAEAGTEVEGATVESTTTVIYTRQKAK